MAKKVLIVEDESVLLKAAKLFFEKEGFEVWTAMSGNEAILKFEAGRFDLILLDIMLPNVSGWELCRKFRKVDDVPIIMLTARIEDDDILLGFELGADDYVTKPYSPKVLLARALRLLEKRGRGLPRDPKIISILGITLDLERHDVSVDSRKIHLTHTEFELLLYLMKNQGKVLSRNQIILKVLGYDGGDDASLSTHIWSLRQKLGPKSKLIKTIVRTGYRFGE